MANNFLVTHRDNCITIDTSGKGAKERLIAEDFYFNALSLCFLRKAVRIITIQPQPYSLGFELEAPENLKVDGKEILLNYILDCTDEDLKKISQSEEFTRGLLILGVGIEPVYLIINEIVNFQRSLSDKLSVGESVVAFCNNDGDYLYLCNSSIPEEKFYSL